MQNRKSRIFGLISGYVAVEKLSNEGRSERGTRATGRGQSADAHSRINSGVTKCLWASLLNLERAMGIEPTSEAWEASILPLYDARSAHYANKPA